MYEAADKHFFSRMQIGEELSHAYVENTILRCIEVWNNCVDTFNDTIATDNLEQLRPMEGQPEDADDDNVAQSLSTIQAKMRALLMPVIASNHPEAIKKLGQYHCLLPSITICPGPYGLALAQPWP